MESHSAPTQYQGVNYDVSRETFQLLILRLSFNVSRETITLQDALLFSDAEAAENTVNNLRLGAHS